VQTANHVLAEPAPDKDFRAERLITIDVKRPHDSVSRL
jgi:hypothetical protein